MERMTLLKTFLNIREILPISWKGRGGNRGRRNGIYDNAITAALDYVEKLSVEGEKWNDTFNEELKELINFPNGKTFQIYGKIKPTLSDKEEKTRIQNAIIRFVGQVKTSLLSMQGNFISNSNTEINKLKPTPKRTKVKKKRGRNKLCFDNCVIIPSMSAALIQILQDLAKGKEPKEISRIIIACVDVWINRPSPIAVVRMFEEAHIKVNKTSIQDRLKCQYEYKNLAKPKYKPFSEKELVPIREIIKEKLATIKD